MGFECGFDRFKRYKDVSVEEFINIKDYLYWLNNTWYHTVDPKTNEVPYPTYEKYWNSVNLSAFTKAKFPGIPDPEKVEFYQKSKDEDEEIAKNINFWCSIGRYLDEFISDELISIDGFYFKGVDMNFVNEAHKWVTSELEHCRLVPVSIVKGYINTDDDNIKTVTVDGIEVEDEYGNLRRVDKDYFELYVGSIGFDEDKHNALTSFADTLDKIEEILKEDEYIVYYYRG